MKDQDLKETGNKCIKAEKYAEAVFHYTHALKIDDSIYQIYSNRSFAFLKMQQYYYALQDANKVIELNPEWAKGYFRKAEVEYQTQHYAEALESYRKALQLQEDENGLVELIRKTKQELVKQQKDDQQVPWVAAGFGFVLGILAVICAYILPKTPYINNVFLQVFIIILAGVMGFYTGKLHRYSLQKSRKGFLEPPIDLFGEDSTDSLFTQSSNSSSRQEVNKRNSARQRHSVKT
ncbi:hsp70-Hsp90 organizing protein 1-like isoform X1 [Limulus polyphemus]|uniref:Hsp70-Hsp90 organizing protein 1-like isoform X1 n=1 Tax=Limulus polyphemus TaxID=6850 RepID=A0ABM1BFP7_LIMPO|nr:hsp70-Hsp90 organizing protein 1-like isoform X1 [Limulus polyphemus]